MEYLLERWNQETKQTKCYTLTINDIEIDGGEDPSWDSPGSGAGANFSVWLHGHEVTKKLTERELNAIQDYILEVER